MHYNFLFTGNSDNSYIFETDFSIVYDVKFKPSSYLFDGIDTHIANQVYESIIGIVYKPTTAKAPLDKRIGSTIAHIFNDFFSKNSNSISIYICDSSDKKQEVRMKKFNQWFYEFHDSTFIKIDEKLIDTEKNSFPIAMILKINNPNRMAIIDAFIKITENQNTGK